MTEAEAIMAAGAAEAQTPTKPRLLITRMEMENFKSYYGVQSVGPFHKVCLAQRGGGGGSREREGEQSSDLPFPNLTFPCSSAFPALWVQTAVASPM